jgi:hypothetical protein
MPDPGSPRPPNRRPGDRPVFTSAEDAPPADRLVNISEFLIIEFPVTRSSLTASGWPEDAHLSAGQRRFTRHLSRFGKWRSRPVPSDRPAIVPAVRTRPGVARGAAVSRGMTGSARFADDCPAGLPGRRAVAATGGNVIAARDAGRNFAGD